MEAPLIDLRKDAPPMVGAVAKDPLGMIDLLTGDDCIPVIGFPAGKDYVSVIDFGGDKEIDLRTFVSTSEMPLQNWISFKGPIASQEVMVKKLGLTPRPGVSTSKSVPVILSQSESFIIKIESLDMFSTLMTNDYSRTSVSLFALK